MDKLTNLEQLRAASLAAKGLIGEVAGATAQALEEMAAELGELAGRQQGGIPVAAGGIPSGGIIIWSGSADAVPGGWALCDGENGTPDLRDRFVVGAGSSYSVGAIGGEKTHTLTESEMPRHSHGFIIRGSSDLISGLLYATVQSTATKSATYSTYSAGGSSAHNNMPPYYALCYIMKL